MEIFPKHAIELWNKWELRMLVLLSMAWQIILIIFGSRRKYISGSLISGLVWVTYLSADWLATVSLGTLASSQGDVEKNSHVLQALWAPFLLLHLGGPDTITAYSLEDNSLWLRHLLGLLVQLTVAFYIYLKSWSTSALTFIAIPVFISGIIKYFERTLVLRSASPQQFEDSLLSTPLLQNSADHVKQLVHVGYSLFPLLKRLYANLSLQFVEGQRSCSFLIGEGTPDIKYAFQLIEVQLGLLYDVLYTKATIIYSLPGILCRIISVVSIVSALVAFFVIVDDHVYSRVDIIITYILFGGAVLLELYAFVSLIFSDWTTRWLMQNNSSVRNFINPVISHCRSISPHGKRSSESVAQHSLLRFCLKNRVNRCIGSDVLYNMYFTLELYWQRKWEKVDDHLKLLIFEQLLEKHSKYKESGFDYNVLKELLSDKGLRKDKRLVEISWSTEVEFDHSLLIWHIATDICYFSTTEKDRNDKREASKKLSDYMLYILLMRPFMLPKWIDRIKHVRDTFREATRILQRRQLHVRECADASKVLIQMHTQSHQPLEQLREGKSGKSVLLDGCGLASQLQKLENPWDRICEVWIEMLTYAASQCEWEVHAQQLRRGGELLTHVCLLMADLGLNRQFDIGSWRPAIEIQNEGWGWVKSQIINPYF